MHYAELKNYDTANGTGVRVSLFVSGCTNHCKNCFQPETWDFGYGTEFTEETANRILEMMKPEYIEGLTVLGGEPFEPANQQGLLPFIKKIRNLLPEKSVWAYTGFMLEELRTEGSHSHCDITEELLSMIDVLVDGRFEEDKKDLTLRFRGSSNQRIIDMKSTLKSNEIILWD